MFGRLNKGGNERKRERQMAQREAEIRSEAQVRC